MTLDGELTVRTAEAIHARLMAADAPVVELDCRGATEVDASFIQLVLAARRSAQRQQRSLALSAPAEGALHDALHCGGFLPATAADTDDQAFWLQPTRT